MCDVVLGVFAGHGWFLSVAVFDCYGFSLVVVGGSPISLYVKL